MKGIITKKGSIARQIGVFLLVVMTAGIASFLPLLFSGFLSARASILFLLLGIVFSVIYLRTGAKKYLFVLIGLLAIILIVISLPIGYPYCGKDWGYGRGPEYYCSCAGLIRERNSRQQCIGLRLSCYDFPKSRVEGPAIGRVGTEYKQYADIPDEADALAYFDKKARLMYGVNYTGELHLKKELLKEIRYLNEETGCVSVRESNICESSKFAKQVSEIKNYVIWYAQIGISCDRMDIHKGE